MVTRININCDMGEGFGRWTLGDDAGILPLVPTANIATGFHGGDPTIMRRVVGLAQEVGADIGAHVSLPDLLGFGRRRIDVSPQELQDYDHLSDRGARRVRPCRRRRADPRQTARHPLQHGRAGPGARTRRPDGGPRLRPEPDRHPRRCGDTGHRQGTGLRVLPEAYCDLDYHPNGYPVVERHKRAWDPEEVARRALRIALEQRGTAVDGTELKLDMRTMCIHGDAANAVEVADARPSAAGGSRESRSCRCARLRD